MTEPYAKDWEYMKSNSRFPIVPTSAHPALFWVEAYENGTGWLIAPNVLITAAHVIAGSEGNFNIGRESRRRNVKNANVDYFCGDYQQNQGGGPCDVAAITLNFALGGEVFNVMRYEGESKTTILGYFNAKPHKSEGPAAQVDAYLCYNAGTEQGFSGGPVLANGDVIAIHLATNKTSSPLALHDWPDSLDRAPFAPENYGLVIQGPLLSFLQEKQNGNA